MSDAQTTESTATSKSPTHIAYQVRENHDKSKSYWTRIGVAWAHKDAKGFNIEISAVPVDGRLTLRVASEKKE